MKEKVYRIRTKDVSDYINEMNISLILYIFLAVTMALLLAIALYLVPKGSIIGIAIIGTLLIATIVVFYFLLKNYNRFNSTLKKLLKKEDGTIFKIVGKKNFVYRTDKEKILFSCKDILKIKNHFVEKENSRSPYFGQGYLEIDLENKKSIKIPSIVFDEKRGFFKIKKIFKRMNGRYEEKHIRSSEMLVHFYQNKIKTASQQAAPVKIKEHAEKLSD